ncbi:regulator of volume decrease after cellular swelling-domain-containing protein [Rhodotorula diobovata]|uniref:Regulator of volume decrease after cellular swelling-domain-containing protein n=1 Tax=Rhodotorula diobovata TaxID=5288 RepID=A0A5C5FVG5_9BASI|nr:regulator of volume decrease after cellular swelling-domain-containing protein [Rhodotorula diobovata]
MPVTVLSGPPSALSRDELVAISAETPSTFEGIPPLTRHHEPEGVRVRVDPPFEGFTGDGLDGQLFVTEEALSFFSPSSSTGISLPYPHLTLHAISRQPAPPSSSSSSANGADAAAQGGPCIYCQFEESAQMDDDDDGMGTREMWITPRDEASVDAIFAALSLCASLHPPPTTTTTTAPSVLSQSAHNSGDADSPSAVFAAMGLDPSSMVYAAADGSLAGPGLAALQADEGQWEDAEGEGAGEEAGHAQGESSAGRTRSEFVNEGRARGAPY